MKSLKNHFSLVIALLSILFSLQTFIIVDRSLDAYKETLTNNYSLVIVSQKKIDFNALKNKNRLISKIIPLSPDSVIKRLDVDISKKNVELLKLSIPKFYKLKLTRYPSPQEIHSLTKSLLRDSSIIKVESFAKSHDTIFKLLLLFKTVIFVFACSMGIVTILLIAKELKIWQFKHHERMSIMSLFGAPTWLRSAVLFRLAIVDALIASFLAFILFSYLDATPWISEEFSNIGIKVTLFDKITDFPLMLLVATSLSIVLASFIVIGHKEEV